MRMKPKESKKIELSLVEYTQGLGFLVSVFNQREDMPKEPCVNPIRNQWSPLEKVYPDWRLVKLKIIDFSDRTHPLILT